MIINCFIFAIFLHLQSTSHMRYIIWLSASVHGRETLSNLLSLIIVLLIVLFFLPLIL